MPSIFYPIVGGILGFALGGPAGALAGAGWGYQFGNTLEGAAPPIQISPGFKSPAYDLSVDKNTIAQDLPIAIIYGKNKIFGNVIRQEPDPTTPTQRMKYWIGLCEGPINGISEIRLNNKLFDDLLFDETSTGWQKFPAMGDPGAVDHFWTQLEGRTFENTWQGATVEILDGPLSGYRGRIVNARIRVADTFNCIIYITPPLPSIENGTWTVRISACDEIINYGDRVAIDNKSLASLYLEATPGDYIKSTNIEISSVVEGLLVYIPDGWPTVEDIPRMEYTTNPAWCIYDFLAIDRPVGAPKVNYGIGIPRSRIDLDSFKDAASYFAEVLDDGQARFECNYIIDSKKSGVDHLLTMLSACNSLLIDKEGYYSLRPQKGNDPVVQVFDNDSHRDLKWMPEGTERRTNQIKGRFTEAPFIYHSGTAQGGDIAAITLSSSASQIDDEYNGMVLEIISGAGIGQIKDIVDYTGSTRLAVIDGLWDSNFTTNEGRPDETSVYEIRKGKFEIISVIVDDPIAQDEDGEVICKEIDLLPCNTVSQAGRIAQMHLDGIRLGNGLCQFITGLVGVHCNPGDVIELNSSRMMWGYGCTQQAVCENEECPGTYYQCVETYAATEHYQGTGLLFRILQIRERQEHRELEITAKREHPGIYHDGFSGKAESRAYATMNPFCAPAPVTGLILADAGCREPDGKWKKAIRVSFQPPNDHFYKEAVISISYDGWRYEEVARTADITCLIYPKKEAARIGMADDGTTIRLEHSLLTDRADDFYVGAVLTITAGTNAGQIRTVTDSGDGWVEWNEPMPEAIDNTSEYTIGEYSIRVQSVNKFGIVSLTFGAPEAAVVLQSPEFHLQNAAMFQEFNGLKSLSPVTDFFHYTLVSPLYAAGRPSIFMDLDGDNLGLYVAHVRSIFTPTGRGVYVNNTLIYESEATLLSVSLHSTRDGYAWLCFPNTSYNLLINQVDVTTSPWGIASPQQISISGAFYSPQIHMIDSTHFYCVASKYNAVSGHYDIVLFKGDTSGNVIGDVVTLWSGQSNSEGWYPDLIWDGTNIYVVFTVYKGTGQPFDIYVQKLTGTPALVGSPSLLFTWEVGDYQIGNFPHIEMIGGRLYFLWAQISEAGVDSTLFMAESDLEGAILVDPHPAYLLRNESGLITTDNCQGVDLFVGGLGSTDPDLLNVAWLQDQSDGVDDYQYVYRHRMKKIVLSSNTMDQLYGNLI